MAKIIKILHCYAVPCFLILTILWHLFDSYVSDIIPLPQSPYEGYVSYEPDVMLQWGKNGLQPPFLVQVVPNGGSFETPQFQKLVKSDMYILPKLDPGVKWHWRVFHPKSGAFSRVSSFSTAQPLVNYR